MKPILFLILCFFAPLAAKDRRSAAPYLSGDTFRAYADFIIDETNLSIIPENVTEGSTVFLNMDYADYFFSTVHPQIRARYILITHNSDHPIPGHYGNILDDPKLIAWFGQNTEGCIHPKLHPIPIGIANRHWEHGNVELLDFLRHQFKSIDKTHLVYINFSVYTYFQERVKVFNRFFKERFCFVSKPKKFESYLIDMAASKFVLSPRGNGLDAHRTWESLYMGAIPIVRSSTADSMYEGLPVVITKDWKDLTEQFLKEKYEEMSKKTYNLEKLYAEYWFRLIESYRCN